MKMNNKLKLFVAVLAVLIFSTGVFANTPAVDVEYIRINGNRYADGDVLRVELGSELDIEVKLRANDNVSNLEVASRLVGYRFAEYDMLRTFDMRVVDRLYENDVTYVRLRVDAPIDMDRDRFNLRISVDGPTANFVYNANYQLRVVGATSRVMITRVSFDPAAVIAGRALRTRVRLENLGSRFENDVFVTVAIPELGSAMFVTADINELDVSEVLTTEDLLLRIPECAPEGLYDVVVTVEYNNGRESTRSVESINILKNEDCGAATVEPTETRGRTVIIPPQTQEVVAGGRGVSFPVVISNEGTTDRTYAVSVTGVSGWGSSEITTPAPLVRAGQSEVVYVTVAAASGEQGSRVFQVVVSDGRDSKSIPVTATVVRDSSMDWTNVLYVAVIVLLVLIIILGLVIGLGKSRGDNDKEYY
ncbi:MAG: hypothetical protein ACMXYK_05310 [Candidatus Woesearchaeota archaeon]